MSARLVFVLRTALGVVLLTVLGAAPLLAAEDGDPIDAEKHPLVVVALAVVFWLGVGGSIALLRVILAELAAAADRSASRLGTRRLLVGGVLPLVGAGLVAAGVDAVGVQPLSALVAIVLLLPLGLAALVGALGGLPRIGARLLKDGAESGELKRCLVGGVVLGLACVTLLIEPVGVLLLFLVTAWLVGIGVGVVVRAPPPPSEA